MKRFKKILSFWLAGILLLCSGVVASAQEEATLRVVPASANRSETVDVAVELSNNPGIVAVFIEIGYDADVLSLQSVRDGGLLGVGTMVAGGDTTANPYRVLWSDSLSQTNHTQDGVLVTLTFAVDANAPYGDTQITLTSKDSSCFDRDLNLVSFCTQNGTVTVNAPTGHTHQYETTIVPPTCTQKGYTTHTCSACGDSYVTDETDPLPHSYETVVTDPTCTHQGFTTYTCTACGYSYQDNRKEKLPHTYETYVIAPTCTQRGYTAYTCKDCGYAYKTQYTYPKGHQYDQIVKTMPTCTQKGYTTYTCSACADSFVADETGPKAHTYASVVTAPTCTQKGYTTHTCTACGNSYKDSETPAKGHRYTAEITLPTCTESGYTTYFCNACGDRYIADRTEPSHRYSSQVTSPTCTEKGYTAYTCTLCGVCFSADEVPPVGHSFGEWIVVKEATQTEPGRRERTCKHCKAQEIQAVPMLPSVSIHNYNPNLILEYRTTISFTADVSNPVDEAEIHWFVDGVDVGAGERFTVKEATKSFTIQAKLICDGEMLAESQAQSVSVKTGFVAKIVAFFKALLRKLPVLPQAYLGIEKR